MGDHAAEIIPEFVPDATLVIEQNSEIKRENLRADLVYMVQRKGRLHVLDMELQTDADSDMVARLMRYHTELHFTYKLPVISLVLYLFETNVPLSPYIEESDEEILMTFHFRVKALWKMDAREYLERRVIYMYTFLPGMKGADASLLIQAIEAMKQYYDRAQLARHLTRFRTILRRSRMVTEEDRQKVEGYMQAYDSLVNGQPWFEELLERKAAERVAERVAEKVAEKVTEKEVYVWQQAVLETVEAQFPALLELARERVPFLRNGDSLHLLWKQVIRAPDEATARWLLDTLPAQPEK